MAMVASFVLIVEGEVYICKCKTLGYLFPSLGKELLNIDPYSISAYSHDVVLWRCNLKPICEECGTIHEWTTSVKRRSYGEGCLYCPKSGSEKCCKCMSLGWNYPKLIQEISDKGLDPFKISKSSGKNIEWRCSKISKDGKCGDCGTNHVWHARVSDRCNINGHGCPWCSNHNVCQL